MQYMPRTVTLQNFTIALKRRVLELTVLKCIIFICIGIFVVAVFVNSLNDEINNNVTLVVEIGVGIIIAIIIYNISQKNELKIKEMIEDTFSIIKKRDDFRKKQETYMKKILLGGFIKIKNCIDQILHNAKSYEKEKDASQKKRYTNAIKDNCKQIKDIAEKTLDNPTLISKDWLEVSKIDTLKTLSSLCKNSPSFEHNNVNVNFCENIEKMIDPWIEDYRQILENKSRSEKEVISISESVSVHLKEDESRLKSTPIESEPKSVVDKFPISVSSDRTVYPLDSVIHVRVNLGNIIKKEIITYEIFNSDRELLLSQTLNPSTCKESELSNANIFQADFKMKGDKWIVGNEYIVRATHAASYAEDSFTIDQRMPVIQSDKSVYTIGSDMILTVIDPDADKDNQIAEYVGNRNDSKLIIESKYDKIDGYKLKETGDSTAIFQGVVRILRIKKDGTVITRNVDGKIIETWA